MTCLIGTEVPAFEVQIARPVAGASSPASSVAVEDIKLEFGKGRDTLLVFYPLNFTFVCPTELLAFSDSIQEFAKAKCDVYGVSVDSAYSHRAWMLLPRKEGGLGPNFKLPLISDLGQKLGKHFQCMVNDKGFHYRASILIDNEGIVRASTVYDTNVGRSVDEALRSLKAFQFSREHGEVCPANFTAETRKVGLIPDPVKASEYFKNNA